MRRKGSLSLSVNAIVVLILAITMLALGLGFIRGMFGKVSSQVEQQVETEPEPPIPTRLIPITLSREAVITNAGEKAVMKISTYNPSNEIWTSKAPAIICLTGDGIPDPIASQNANLKTIKQGEFKTFDLILTVDNVPPNTYLCRMTMVDAYEKDFTIKVKE